MFLEKANMWLAQCLGMDSYNYFWDMFSKFLFILMDLFIYLRFWDFAEEVRMTSFGSTIKLKLDG